MDNYTLAKVLNGNLITKPFFKGVFSIDEIPWEDQENISSKSFYIFNLDKSTEPGSHWVCVLLTPHFTNNFYFDSYGTKPPSSLEDFMKKSYSFCKKQLQHKFSTSCGQWCLYFIYHQCLGWPLKHFYKKFNHKDKLKNDYLVTHIVRKIFQVNPEPLSKVFLSKQLCRAHQGAQSMQKNLRNISFAKE